MTPLEQKLEQLKLPAISRQLEKILTEAASKNLTIAATLEWLTDVELEARRDRAVERRFKCSHLLSRPSIDSFYFNHHKSRLQNKARILRLLDLSLVSDGTNLVLIGNPGVGKHSWLRSLPGVLARRIIAFCSRRPWTCLISSRPPRSTTPWSAS